MSGAGEYDYRVEWFARVPGVPDSFGERVDEYTPSKGYLWGALDNVTGGRESAQESERQVTTATIRLRNYPDVAAGDRLRSTAWGDVWTVRSVTRGDNEVICDVQSPAWSAGGGTV